jgi:hypothetical protein
MTNHDTIRDAASNPSDYPRWKLCDLASDANWYSMYAEETAIRDWLRQTEPPARPAFEVVTAPGRHHGIAGLLWRDADGYREATVRLGNGDSAENPVCTSCRLYGPMTIEYRRYPDGGIDATILEGSDGHAN